MESTEQIIVKGLEQNFPPKKGLEDLVFGNAVETTYDQESVSIDTYDGTRGEAGYTARGAKGQTVGLDGWKTKQVTPPLIDEDFTIGANDLQIRQMGEGNTNNSNVQATKFRNIVTRQTKKLQDRRQRAFNTQIKQLLTTGKVTIVEKDDKGNVKATREEDFKIPATQIYATPKAWSDATADIFKDIRTINSKIQKSSNLTPDYSIVGESTLANMVKNDAIKSLLDNRRINFGDLAQEDKGNGLTYWGTLLNVKIYTFLDFDKDGNEIIPANAYITGSSEAELDITYGSIDMIVGGEPRRIESKMVMTKKVDEEAVAVKHGFKTAKLYCLTQAGAFGHLTTA